MPEGARTKERKNDLIFALKSIFKELRAILKKEKNCRKSAFFNFLFQNSLKSL